MSFHPEAIEPIVILVGLAVTVVIFYYLIRWIRHTLGHMGLSPGEIAVIIWATLVGALINIPIVPFGEGWVGVNVGGAVVPVVLSAYLIRRKGLPINEVIVGVAFVTFVAHAVTRYEPGVGVIAEFPWWLLPPVAAFLVAAFAYWHERPHSAALAYVSGTLGTLMGADILRLPEIFSGPAPTEPVIMSLGGAGVFDMVFLTGILAVTMEAGLLTKTREDIVTQSQHDPIHAEYQAWVERKEKESQQIREKYRQTRRTREDDRTHAKRQVERQSAPERPAQAESATTTTSTTEPRPTHGATARSRSRYQPRTSSSHQSRYHTRGTFKSRYRGQRTRPTKYRDTQEPLSGQAARDEQEADTRERQREQRQDTRAREGPRPPPRQPRPASGTKRIPASHRARGLYR